MNDTFLEHLLRRLMQIRSQDYTGIDKHAASMYAIGLAAGAMMVGAITVDEYWRLIELIENANQHRRKMSPWPFKAPDDGIPF